MHVPRLSVSQSRKHSSSSSSSRRAARPKHGQRCIRISATRRPRRACPATDPIHAHPSSSPLFHFYPFSCMFLLPGFHYVRRWVVCLFVSPEGRPQGICDCSFLPHRQMGGEKTKRLTCIPGRRRRLQTPHSRTDVAPMSSLSGRPPPPQISRKGSFTGWAQRKVLGLKSLFLIEAVSHVAQETKCGRTARKKQGPRE